MHEVQRAPHRADRYERPVDLAEALELLDEYGADARILAGGSDLLLEMQRRVRTDHGWATPAVWHATVSHLAL